LTQAWLAKARWPFTSGAEGASSPGVLYTCEEVCLDPGPAVAAKFRAAVPYAMSYGLGVWARLAMGVKCHVLVCAPSLTIT
jgi:hypothetical protein